MHPQHFTRSNPAYQHAKNCRTCSEESLRKHRHTKQLSSTWHWHPTKVKDN